MASEYELFIKRRSQSDKIAPAEINEMPSYLFDFQKILVAWSISQVRSAVFADCGMGKTAMQLAWSNIVHKITGKKVLLLTPLAVARQTQKEAEKFNIEAKCSFSGEASSPITITNYDKLHLFESTDFAGVACDESSILKHFGGSTQKQITRFTNKTQYRSLWTATAAPNDWIELGTSSEALGELSHSDMLKRFFRQLDDKGQKKEQRLQDEAEKLIKQDGEYYAKLSFRVAQTIGQWRLKNHAVEAFWRWVASWSRALRRPSDIGCCDGGFELPPIHYHDHIIKPNTRQPGRLFDLPAFGLAEERDERRRTLKDRCDKVAELCDHESPSVIWCHMNQEGDMLEQVIPGSRQIAGKTPDEEKVELYEAFSSGQLKKLIIKPKIGAYGLNWQHCSHVISFASHSFEQTYQSVRRCWRFGQTNTVTVDTVATEGEIRVLENMRRKSKQADEMFTKLVSEMNRAERLERVNIYTKKAELPKWL